MPAKLGNYQAKRDFRRTPEPKGRARKSAAAGRFVVQEHDATRLHWDLRLERDGVLVSWAVPNGIPQTPKENRLAVHVEDHPLDYIDFAGEIPEGNYGAGTVRIWDTGTYEAEKWEPKKIIVTFQGERLQGKYALFQTRSAKDWMIHRMDPPADPARELMPERVVPMLAKLGNLPSDERRHGFEIKWDGIRAITYYEPGRLRIESRNLNDITAQYPELRRLGRQLGSRDCVLDGEIVAFDERAPRFERLQQRMHLTREAEIRRRAQEVPVHYMLFDVLYIEGRSMMDRSYEERREVLESMELEGPAWQTPRYHRGQGAALLAASADQGLEGVVAKRLDSRYAPGQRSSAWIKVKNKQRTQLVIGGWLPEKERSKRLGALLVGYYDETEEFRFAGRVGTGWDAKERARLEGRLAPLARERSPFEGRRGPRGARYVEPRLVAEIEFTEWTNDGMLRHPSYKGLVESAGPRRSAAAGRPGGRPAEEAVLDSGETTASLGPRRKVAKNAVEVEVEGRVLRLSNLDKTMYPKTGFTKGDLIDYYVRIASVLLPHLHDRPLTLKRYPDGVEGKHFYEKQCPSHRPDWVQTAAVWSRHNKKNIDFCLVNDLPTMVWAANLADIELHTSLSLAEAVDRPTTMVFDLDPGAPANIIACCRVGLWLRDLFAELELESFAKTSGSKGLQVYVPLNNEEVTYDDTKPFARAVAELIEKRHPKQVVSRMTKSLREGKVLIDWSQNDDHKTTVCVYSLRAKEHPTVSTPVTWDEVEAASRRRSGKVLTFEHDQVLERVERDGDLFAPVLALRQALPSL